MRENFPTVYDAKATRPDSVGRAPVDKVSMAKQEFKEECDINRIMARYRKFGELPASVGTGRYGDFSEVTDYQEAQFILERASAQFAALPAGVRDEFANDPGKFLAFIGDPKNYDRARELGLLKDEAKPKVADKPEDK